MSRYMVSDPTRPTDPILPADPHTFHQNWNDVQDEIPDLDGQDPPNFGEPMQVKDGDVLLTITRLQ